jgi:hypothetical protein
MRRPVALGVAVLLTTTALVAGASPASAKGPPGAGKRIFVRTTDDGVTVRVFRASDEIGGSPEPCTGPGCPPRECAVRGALMLGISTDDGVGQGWVQVYPRTGEAMDLVGAGITGSEFGDAVGWVVAQTGPGVHRVALQFDGGGRDEMQARDHLVALAGPVETPNLAITGQLLPAGRLTAFNKGGDRIGRARFGPDTSVAFGAPPRRCVGGLETGFPPPIGDPPADEDGERLAVSALFTTAYGPGLTLEERAALVEDGESLLEVMEIAAERSPQYRDRITATVEEVRFVDSTHAAARFALESEGMPLISGIGRAVLVDGQWLVSRRTYCGLQQLGGVWCPESKRSD